MAYQQIISRPLNSCLQEIVPKIGLEVHAQLNISSKLFSQGSNSSQASPNSQLDLFDISLPGALPKLNIRALRAAMRSALGLNCTIQNVTHFDRKNYFYSDMPAGFQITQYNRPLAKNGFIDFIVTTHHKSIIAHSQHYDLVKCLYSEDDRKSVYEFEPYIKRSHIKQIQLEQDSAKSLHQVDPKSQEEIYNLVDYNRCGAGLIEVVFEPDLTSHHEASSLIKELIFILKALDTCDCHLQEGSLRVDANVSIKSIEGEDLDSPKRVELKNLNSLKALSRGINHETQRQASLLRSGRQIIQETRTFDTKTGRTVPLRLKEDAVDYRYVPEPNIPPIHLDKELIEKVREELPSENLPCNLRKDLINEFNLDLVLIAELMDEPGLIGYMKDIMKNKTGLYDANIIADFLIYIVANLKDIAEAPRQVDLSREGDFMKTLSPDRMQTLFDMMFGDEISFAVAYKVIKHLFTTTSNVSDCPRKIVNDFGWYQINDQDRINELSSELIKKMKSISKKYSKKGEKKCLGLMLEKLCETTDDRIDVKRAIESINQQLNPPNVSKSPENDDNRSRK